MARKRRSRKQNNDFPGWVWMLFGLAIGLAVALAIYIQEPATVQVARQAPEPTRQAAQPAPAIDNNGESATAEEVPEQRFTFYDMLPAFEVEVPNEGAEVTIEAEPRAVTEPGAYLLQAGSFSKYEDAERRRAQLALHGIEAEVVPYRTPERTFHRVRIGPIDDLDELNVLRSRLRQANIDVLRIRLGDN